MFLQFEIPAELTYNLRITYTYFLIEPSEPYDNFDCLGTIKPNELIMIKHYKNSLCQLQKIFEMLSIVQAKRL